MSKLNQHLKNFDTIGDFYVKHFLPEFICYLNIPPGSSLFHLIISNPLRNIINHPSLANPLPPCINFGIVHMFPNSQSRLTNLSTLGQFLHKKRKTGNSLFHTYAQSLLYDHTTMWYYKHGKQVKQVPKINTDLALFSK